MDNIDQKDKQLDLRLARIENERNALKTEYDTVKDLVKKNIERSYKTFNAQIRFKTSKKKTIPKKASGLFFVIY